MSPLINMAIVNWYRGKIATILHTTVSNQLSWMIMIVLVFKFTWPLFSINDTSASIRIMACLVLKRRKSLSEAMIVLTIYGLHALITNHNSHFADEFAKCISLKVNVWISNKIWLKYVSKGPINNMAIFVPNIVTDPRPGTSHSWFKGGDFLITNMLYRCHIF